MAEIGSFGDVVFSASDSMVLQPHGMSRTAGSEYASHDIVAGKPRKEYRHAKLRSFSMTVELSALFGVRPRTMLDRLAEIAEAGEVYDLVIGGMPVAENPMALTGVSESWGEVYSGGQLSRASVSLTFEEYV